MAIWWPFQQSSTDSCTVYTCNSKESHYSEQLWNKTVDLSLLYLRCIDPVYIVESTSHHATLGCLEGVTNWMWRLECSDQAKCFWPKNMKTSIADNDGDGWWGFKRYHRHLSWSWYPHHSLHHRRGICIWKQFCPTRQILTNVNISYLHNDG